MACRSAVACHSAIQSIFPDNGYVHTPFGTVTTIAIPSPIRPIEAAAKENKATKLKGKIACVEGLNVIASTLPGGSGGGILEKPTIDRGTPGRESEFDLVTRKKSSPPYRVLLHNDNFNRREYVVQVLMKCIPGMTVDNAVNIMQEAHVNGMAVVIICDQDDAEEHCLQLRTNGLVSSIEPASGNC